MIERMDETTAVGTIEGEKRNLYLTDLTDDPYCKHMYLDRPDTEATDNFVMLIGSGLVLGFLLLWVMFS